MTKTQIQKLIDKEKIVFIYLQFSDLLGQIKNVVIHVDKWQDAVENGVWFDGSSVEGFARIAESDMLLRPDLRTFAIIPWSPPERRAARVFCEVFRPSGRRLAADPRFILQKVIRKAARMGFDFRVGAEFEFYLFERECLPKLVPHDYKSYFDYTPHSRAAAICESVMKALSFFGVKNEMYHHEVGQGQHEIDIAYDQAMKSADNIMALRMALKAYTVGTELKASWMPKPIFGFPGNGFHIHQSLWQGGKNIFYHPRHRYRLSLVALQFLAGQLAHAKALSAVVSPTVNSYKRLVSGFEAPVYICWGQTNRSALIRIPQSSPKKLERGARLEYRAPDSSSNPYLTSAALLAAGLDGIAKKMAPPVPIEENVYEFRSEQLIRDGIETLPATLKEAINALEKDEVVSGIFGLAKDKFLQIKNQEWQKFAAQVTPWEMKRYF